MDEIERVVCAVCEAGESEDCLMLCDGCNTGYHTFCLNPPLSTVPEGDFFCSACTTAGRKRLDVPTAATAERPLSADDDAMRELDRNIEYAEQFANDEASEAMEATEAEAAAEAAAGEEALSTGESDGESRTSPDLTNSGGGGGGGGGGGDESDDFETPILKATATNAKSKAGKIRPPRMKSSDKHERRANAKARSRYVDYEADLEENEAASSDEEENDTFSDLEGFIDDSTPIDQKKRRKRKRSKHESKRAGDESLESSPIDARAMYHQSLISPSQETTLPERWRAR